MRKGMDKGHGSGYRNIVGKDPMVHKMSAMGIKQPQRAPYYAVNPALTKYSNVKLQEGAVEERIKHPKFSMTQARQIALDNLRGNPRAYGKCGGKYVVYSWKKTPKQGGIFTELNTEKEAQKLVKDMNRIHKTNEWVYANPNDIFLRKKDKMGRFVKGGKGGKIISKFGEDYKLVNNDLDVYDIKQAYAKNAGGYDGFFVKIKNGEYKEIYGYTGVPKLNKNAVKLKIKRPKIGGVCIKYPTGGKMSKKDYEAFAQSIGKNSINDRELAEKMIREFVNYMKKDNPKFDEKRFFDRINQKSIETADVKDIQKDLTEQLGRKATKKDIYNDLKEGGWIFPNTDYDPEKIKIKNAKD